MPQREPLRVTSAHNELSAGADQVVQARDIHGGAHVHGSSRATMPAPQLLPPDVAHFTGRDVELGLLDALWDTRASAALVISSISGAAGIGKTSLVVRWAHRVRDRFPGGQLYVNLRGFDPGPPATPEQVLDGLLRALGVPGEGIPQGLDAMSGCYRSLLMGQRMLVVLDNAATPEQDHGHRLPPTAGHQQVEQDRAPVVLPHLHQLARTPTHQPRSHRGTDWQHPHRHRPDRPRRV
jgi:hypothetical protein